MLPDSFVQQAALRVGAARRRRPRPRPDDAHATVRSVRGIVGQCSVDACIEDGQRFLEYLCRGLPNSPRFPGTEVDRLDLLDHDEAGHVLAFGNRHMEGVVAAGVGNVTNNAKARVFVEEVVADDEGGTTPSWLVT